MRKLLTATVILTARLVAADVCQDLAGGFEVSVAQPETVMTASERQAEGMMCFGDGNLGFHREGPNLFVYGANCGTTEALVMPDFDALRYGGNWSSYAEHTLIFGPHGAFDEDYAGGGPVYYDSGSGILLHLYHGEYHWAHGRFYSALGLAFSRDAGKTFTKLGEAISPQAKRANNCQIDIGSGTLLRVGGYFYTYFTDTANCLDNELTVARAPIADVLALVRTGGPVPGKLWQKYYQGSFSQPALNDPWDPAAGGGAFSPILSLTRPQFPDFPNVLYDACARRYVLATMLGWEGIGIAFSSDGIHFETMNHIISGSLSNSAIYPTLVGTDPADPTTIGSEFYVYYIQPGGDWSRSDMRRLKITLVPVGTPADHGARRSETEPLGRTSGGSSRSS